jgi:hypothetical protein
MRPEEDYLVIRTGLVIKSVWDSDWICFWTEGHVLAFWLVCDCRIGRQDGNIGSSEGGIEGGEWQRVVRDCPMRTTTSSLTWKVSPASYQIKWMSDLVELSQPGKALWRQLS